MVPRMEWLTELRNTAPRNVVLGDGTKIRCNVSGDLTVFAPEDGTHEGREIVLNNVLYVPQLSSGLLSVGRLCEQGYEISFSPGSCQAHCDDGVAFVANNRKGVYEVDATPLIHEFSFSNRASVKDETLNLWHQRLGHAHPEGVKKLAKSNVVDGLELDAVITTKDPCGSCMKGKQTKSILRTNTSRSSERGAVIHSDVCGPMSVTSFSGCRYFVIFIDEYSGFKTVIPIVRKSDVKEAFIRYQAWLERKFECKIKKFHSDGGGEFIALEEYMVQQGIEQTMTPPHSPNLNGIAERGNRTIVECARSMMQHASLPRVFWGEAVSHAAKIRNMFFCPKDATATPYEVMRGIKPNVSHLRVFGCLAWHHIPKDNRRKLDAKSEPGILIGCYENSQYKIWIPSRNVAVLSRDVTFSEDVFPGEKISQWPESEDDVVMDSFDVSAPSAPRAAALAPPEKSVPMAGSDPHACTKRTPEPNVLREVGVTSEEHENLTYYPERVEGEGTPEDIPNLIEDEPDSDDDDAMEDPVPSRDEPDESEGRRYPLRSRAQTSFFSPASANQAVTNSDDAEPDTVDEALSMPDGRSWRDAIESELKSLDEHSTWVPSKLPTGVKPLSTRFVFKRKFDESGELIRHKARLVVRGFLQGNVENTYSPVVEFTTIRTALALAVEKGHVIHQMDVKTAFLHGKIDEDVYVTPPEGMDIFEDHEVLKLQRGLYGLKQAPRLWNERWREVMEALGFQMLTSDNCAFKRDSTLVLLYVDDIIIISPALQEVTLVKTQLSGHLDVKDMGALHFFRGINFCRHEEGAWLSQEAYTKEVLRRYGMSNCKPMATPMIEIGTAQRTNGDTSALSDSHQYQEVIGSLLFLATRTRPDICAAVGILCRYTSAPTAENWVQLKRVLRYLRATTKYGLRIWISSEPLVAYCDADWGGCRTDRKSTTGYLMTLGGSCISWRTMKQKCIALSTTEAEFIAMSEAAKELIWLRNLLSELGEVHNGPTIMFGDKQGAQVWGPEGVRRAKHVAIRANYGKEQVDRNVITLAYCPSATLTADVLTKPLLRVAFEKHRNACGVLEMEN